MECLARVGQPQAKRAQVTSSPRSRMTTSPKSTSASRPGRCSCGIKVAAGSRPASIRIARRLVATYSGPSSTTPRSRRVRRGAGRRSTSRCAAASAARPDPAAATRRSPRDTDRAVAPVSGPVCAPSATPIRAPRQRSGSRRRACCSARSTTRLTQHGVLPHNSTRDRSVDMSTACAASAATGSPPVALTGWSALSIGP